MFRRYFKVFLQPCFLHWLWEFIRRASSCILLDTSQSLLVRNHESQLLRSFMFSLKRNSSLNRWLTARFCHISQIFFVNHQQPHLILSTRKEQWVDDESGIINCNLRKIKCNNVLNSNNKILEKLLLKRFSKCAKDCQGSIRIWQWRILRWVTKIDIYIYVSVGGGGNLYLEHTRHSIITCCCITFLLLLVTEIQILNFFWESSIDPKTPYQQLFFSSLFFPTFW